MADENLRIMERMMAAFNEGSFDAVMDDFDPDAELYDPDMPAGTSIKGLAAIREMINGMIDAFDSMSVLGFRLIPAGDRVLTLTHIRGQGEGRLGGVEVELRDAHLMTFRDDKITYWRMYTDRNEAIRDLGLDPADYPPE